MQYKDVAAYSAHNINQPSAGLVVCLCTLFSAKHLPHFGFGLKWPRLCVVGIDMCAKRHRRGERERKHSKRRSLVCSLLTVCSCRSYFMFRFGHGSSSSICQKLFEKSQNLKFYRYNSVHKSFEVFQFFLFFFFALKTYFRNTVCSRYFMLWFLNIFVNSDIFIRFFFVRRHFYMRGGFFCCC